MPAVLQPFRLNHPRAHVAEGAFPAPCLFTDNKSNIIDDILAPLNKNGLTVHQSISLLERLGGIIEMG
jgi:hypothetical protein